jgi:hypothetical protein
VEPVETWDLSAELVDLRFAQSRKPKISVP